MQVGVVGLLHQGRREERGARADLACTYANGFLHNVRLIFFQEQTDHDSGVELAQGGDGGGVEGNQNCAGRVFGGVQGRDKRVVHSPGGVVFHLKVENNVVFARERQDFFQSGDAFAHVLAVKPVAGVELAKLGERKVVDGTAAVGGALERGIVDGDEASVAGEVQVGFDECGAQFDGTAEGGQSVFRRSARSAAMCDDPRISHFVRYRSRVGGAV